MTAERIDLGDDHWLEYISWAPDRALNPQWAGMPDIPRAGAHVGHRRPDTGAECTGFIFFDVPGIDQISTGADNRWQVESWEPLTIAPSLLCGCGDHGFIRSGKWVRA